MTDFNLSKKMNIDAWINKDLWFNLHLEFVGKKELINSPPIKLVGPYISEYGANIDAQNGRVDCICIKKERLNKLSEKLASSEDSTK